MSEPVEEPTTAVDYSALIPEDAPAITEPVSKPDFKASRPRRSLFTPAGDKRDTTTAKRATKEKAKLPAGASRRGYFVEPLTTLYTSIGMGLMMVDPVCAKAVITAAPQCAEALDEMAYRNEAVRRILFSIINTSAFGKLLAAHFPIIMAVVMHHVPAAQNMLGGMGQKFADSVEAQMREQSGESDSDAA